MNQESKILQLLSDNAWHCGQEINGLYIKDDRKRISDLIKKGYLIETKRCDLKGHIHTSKIVMRKLKGGGNLPPTLEQDSGFMKEWREEFMPQLDKLTIKKEPQGLF